MYNSQRENRRRHWYRVLTIGQKKLLAIGVLVFVLLIAILTVVGIYTCRAMKYDLGRVLSDGETCVLFDSRNEPISTLEGRAGDFVAAKDLPQQLINAFVAREDAHFFSHSGIVYSAVFRSLLRNMSSLRYEQGASTITMQLTRNVFELREKTLDRKLLEAFLSQRVERNYDKMTILTQYLNRIYFGQGCHGVGAAAKRYFGKKVSDLTLAECAALAGIVRGPSIFNPVTSMEKAMEVKAETLDRMLEEEMITEAEHDEALIAPLVLNPVSENRVSDASYPAMWAKRELDALREKSGITSGGLSVVSCLRLPVQNYLEQATERALKAAELRGYFPKEWESLLPEEASEAHKAAFIKAHRPKNLKVRGVDNDTKGLLQACVLVVDMRSRSQGNILALVSGRSSQDGIDRWNGTVQPGRVAAPLVFCCACLPGADDSHIVARSAEVTGSGIGYDVVRSFIDSLDISQDLPAREESAKLYNGLYPVKRIDLAKVLFSLRNLGRGYQLSLLQSVWDRSHRAIYVREREKAPEYIRRESATSVASLSPFVCVEGKPTVLSEALPEGAGQWVMVSNDLGVAVFVWMGMDEGFRDEELMRKLQPIIAKSALYLAREIHTYTRTVLREEMKSDASRAEGNKKAPRMGKTAKQ